jgi:predicted DNA-binding transcriptional regulator AlpA
MPPSAIPSGESLLKLPVVLQRFPVSRSKWYQGIKDGIYPAAIKLGPRASAWRSSDIDTLISSL